MHWHGSREWRWSQACDGVASWTTGSLVDVFLIFGLGVNGRGCNADHEVSSEGRGLDFCHPENRRMIGFLVIWDGARGFLASSWRALTRCVVSRSLVFQHRAKNKKRFRFESVSDQGARWLLAKDSLITTFDSSTRGSLTALITFCFIATTKVF